MTLQMCHLGHFWHKTTVVYEILVPSANESIAAGTTTINPAYIVPTHLNEDDEAFIDSDKFKVASMYISE